MDFVISCVFFLSVLIFSLSCGIHILFPLVLGLICFSLLGIYRGFSLKSVLQMIGGSMAKVVIVLRVFVLIGIITAVWRACGTIPFFVYYGVSMIDPRFFILFVFILNCLTSLLIGSSIGTAGTMGVVLMIIARSSGADLTITAGAIVAGIYFGDRCAPTSSGANLVAAITETHVLDNVKNMFRSAFFPLIISMVIYLALSFYSGMDRADAHLLSEISAIYDIGIITTVPALVIVILCVFRCSVIISMIVSILFGILVAVFVQGVSLYDILIYMAAGYELKSSAQFASIIAGGGAASMLNTMCIVLISSCYSGIFEGTGVLKDVMVFLKSCSRRFAVYPITLVTAAFTAAFGCTQTISIILTHHMMRGIYSDKGLNDSALALDIEDSSVVVAALIPWNVAVSVPMVMLSAPADCIPYAVFLYILPIYRLFFDYPVKRRRTGGQPTERRPA